MDDIAHYLNTNSSDIYAPSLINHMREGAMMLIKHIKNLDKTYIQVDSDCDGYTSAALLLNYLYLLVPTYVTNCVKWGLHEGK